MRTELDWRLWRWPALGVAVLSYLALAVITPKLPFTMPRLCPFYLITRRDCPLCGLTRALGLISQGKPMEALNKYPRALVVSTAGAGLTAWLLWRQRG